MSAQWQHTQGLGADPNPLFGLCGQAAVTHITRGRVPELRRVFVAIDLEGVAGDIGRIDRSSERRAK
jgi:hypothetical protein